MILELLPFLALFLLGVICARRWLVNPSPKIQKSPRWLRITALVITCWIGAFVSSSASRDLGFLMSDGIAYDEEPKAPYDIIHDGVSNNAVNLFFGWLIGPICWRLATIRFRKK